MGRNIVNSNDSVHSTCHLCGSRHLKHLLNGRDRLHATPGVFAVVQCQDCSLAFIHPQPALENIAGFYPKFYYAYVEQTQPEHSFLKRMELNFRKRKKAEILTVHYNYPREFPKNIFYSLISTISRTVNDVPHYIADGVLLDIGCGKGTYLQQMKELGWQTLGVEFSDSGVQAATQAGLEVLHGTVEEAGFQSDSIDYARMADVLEHLPDPVGTMTEIHRILKPGGMMQISLPNIRSFTFWLFGQYWFPLEIPRHLFFYSPDSLKRICHQTGFEVESLHIWSDKVVDFEPSIQYWLKDAHPKQYQFVEANRWALKLLRKIFSPIKWLANKSGYGSAMTVIIRKPHA